MPTTPPLSHIDPRVNQLVTELIGRVADKWTMLVLEELAERGTMRFSAIGRGGPGISQKMLTQTFRQMERDGLATRIVHPVIPPHVEYDLTPLGHGLASAFCGVWAWAETNLDQITKARGAFDARQ